MRELAGIRDEHSVAEARALVEAHVEGGANGRVVAAKIAQLLGLAEGSATADQTAWAIAHFLARCRPRERPLVVLVDDIHWAEPALLDLLAGLPATIARRADPAPLPGAAGAARAPARTGRSTVRLEPLGEARRRRAAREPARDAPPAVRARLAQAAAGNPLFAEELVAMLLDEGVLRRTGGVCTLAGDLDALALPASLNALLGARLDRLDAEARDALERGAVEGELFHRGAVVELSDPASRPVGARRARAARRTRT